MKAVKNRLGLWGLVLLLLVLCGAGRLGAQEDTAGFFRDMPPVAWTKLSPNLWRIEDATVAYLIRSGDKALMINIGAGRALQDLSPAGVEKIDGVIATHHLRTVTQGLPAAAAAGAWIGAPAKEALLFTDAVRFWSEIPLRNVYHFKPDLMTLTTNVPVAKNLDGGDTLTWENIEFKVLDTPGATAGAISLVAEIDGRKVAFTGDLIVNDGQIPNYWNMQYSYGDGGLPGLRATRKSVDRVLGQKPLWLLPARGPVIEDPPRAAAALGQRIAVVEKLFGPAKMSGKMISTDDHPLPHLYWHKSSYLLTAEDGHAVLIGFSGLDLADWAGPQWLDDLLHHGAFKTIDAIFILNHQDVHLGGVQSLVTTYGCPVYTSSEVIQGLCQAGPDPFLFFRPGLHQGQFKPHIVGTNGDPKSTMEWRGYQFKFLALGGHSYHQMGLFTIIDGARVMFTGQTVRPTNPLTGYFVPWSGLEIPHYTYADAARRIKELLPNKLAAAEDGLLAVDEKILDDFETWAKALEPTLTPLLGSRTYHEGVDPTARYNIYPFMINLRAPNLQRTTVSVRNAIKGALNVQYRFILPSGWLLLAPDQEDRNLFVDAQGTIKANRKGITAWIEPIRLVSPSELPNGRTVIPIEVIDDGHYLGQIMQLIVDQGYVGPEPWTPASGLSPYEYNLKRYKVWKWLPKRKLLAN